MRTFLVCLALVFLCGADKPKGKPAINRTNPAKGKVVNTQKSHAPKGKTITTFKDGKGRADGYSHRPFGGNRVYFYDKMGRQTGSAWVQ